MLKLSYEDYEKNKSLFKEEYLVWDSLKKEFIKDDSKKVVVEIKEIAKLSAEEKKVLKITLDNWKQEIKKINIKKYTDYDSSLYSLGLYNRMAGEMEACLCNFENWISHKLYGYDYFCCYIKQNDLYVAIGIFSITKGEHKYGLLQYSLVLPESQSVGKDRKNGTAGACGHNLRASMINHIFSDKNVIYIMSEPVNNLAKEALKKLKFDLF